MVSPLGRKEGESVNNLQSIRLASGKSQSQLSVETGIPLYTIQKWEQGKRDVSKASGESLLKLSKALGCKIEDLLE